MVVASTPGTWDTVMSLDARIGLRLGTLDLDVSFEVGAGQVLALLGPNGAGKSTVLRAIAGLVPIEKGAITMDGLVLDDPSREVFVAPESRGVAMVFQDYLLFDHMSVSDNVAFGLRARGTRRKDARHRAATMLASVGLAHMADQPTRALSGGQAQRVALARALVTSPRVLLLDEPLAALDVDTRSMVRRDLRAHLAGFDGATILVTHDPVDAFALADQVVIIEDGSVTQSGTMSQVVQRPRSRYVAGLVGVNFLAGLVHGNVFTTAEGATIVGVDTSPGPATVTIRPQSVTVSTQAPESSSARNIWRGRLTDVNHMGERVRVSISDPITLTAEITAASYDELRLELGAEVFFSVKAMEVGIVPD